MALVNVSTNNFEPIYPVLQAETAPQSRTDIEDESISLRELERELPVVDNGQISLSELLSRVAQSVYAELTEIAET